MVERELVELCVTSESKEFNKPVSPLLREDLLTSLRMTRAGECGCAHVLKYTHQK